MPKSLRCPDGSPSTTRRSFDGGVIGANQSDESGALAVIDEYFAGDETFEGTDYKRSLLRLLGLLWPCVADLLGGAPVEQ